MAIIYRQSKNNFVVFQFKFVEILVIHLYHDSAVCIRGNIAINYTWAYPATNKTPQLTFGTAFGSLIGMSAQTYPATIQSTNQSQISTITPIISPVNSYILTCNLINSKYSIPSNVFFSLPLNGSLGQLISYVAPSVVYSDIAPNTYSTIVIQMYDQNFNKLELKDNEIVLTLAIDDSQEVS